MRYKSVAALTGLFAVALFTGVAFMPVSSASPGHSSPAMQNKPSGLTSQGIENAGKAAMPSRLVEMAPQSSLKLLSRARKVGPHAPKASIELTIGLKLRHTAKLKSFLEQVQNPASPAYHQWLTPDRFTARYGPSKTDVAKVVNFLESHSIRVENVSANRMLIHTEAPTRAYEHAFGIRVNDYKLNGRRFYSTADSPKLPRALAPLVANILGLNHGVLMHPHSYFKPMGAAAKGVAPRQAPPPSLTNLNPLQIATAYNVPDITDAGHGAGTGIAIITALSPGVAGNTDYSDFWSAFGLPDHTINVINVGGSPGTGGAGETTLDIEYSGAMGPGATLNVYVTADAQFDTFTDAYNQFVVDNTSAVMSTSWGLYESGTGQGVIQTDEQIFMQAAAQGISMFAAAGDSGAADGGPGLNNADYPSSSVYVTAANGTQLTISDLSGSYGSEVAWNDADCFGNGPAATGGAISQFIGRPSWQAGPGVPAPSAVTTLMNSDVALTASCSKPMLVSRGGSWFLTGGTSAVAPQLAGIFAQAVARNGTRLGQSNKLIYNNVNAGNYASDFHDVTSGCNGQLPDGSDSCAATDWDHPTGWGSLDVTSLLSHIGIQGPKGTLSGTVTDAATGATIAGAVVAAVSATNGRAFSTVVADDGSYSRVLPAGNFDVTVSAYGYSDGTASVTITDGQTTTHDFALQAAQKDTLSGKVTDGSGHGYGLYAEIKVSVEGFGQVADVWTNPADGSYSVELPEGSTYTLDVAAAFNGYNTASGTVTLQGNKSKNFALAVIAACTAPGYHFATGGGISEDFNGSSFPPAGWSVTSAPPAATVVWKLNSAWGEDNVTGGTGTAADADSDAAGNGSGPYDTSLVTPPIAVTSLQGATVLKYKANYVNLADALDLDISTDGGANWTNILHWTTDHGGLRELPGFDVQADLAPYLPASGDFQLRWRFYSNPGDSGWNFYAMIDDVAMGGCTPVDGGLITGRVTAAQSGEGLVGATVTDDLGNSTKTIANPADPNLPVGTYLYFTGNGDRTLTATDDPYSPMSAQVTLPADGIVTQDFALKSARFETDPDSFEMHVKVGNSATASFALSNTGDGTGLFDIQSVNAQPPQSSHALGPFAAQVRYPAGIDLSTMARRGARPHPSGVAPASAHPQAAGDVVTSFPAGIAIYGLATDRGAKDLWLGSPAYGGLGGDSMDHRFLMDGTNTGDTIDVSGLDVVYMADMAFNDNTGMLWQVSVEETPSSQSHIFELDPTTMEPTGKSILVPSDQSERGLAYNPTDNTWYAGDFNSTTLYHFDSSGNLLDSANVGIPVTGLAYNAATGHLFVLTSAGTNAVVVLDADNGYDQVGVFDITGFDSANAGAGLDYDCANELVVSDFTNKVVYLVDSGETGWCNHRSIPWLTVAPEAGTLAPGASTTIGLTFDGTDQEEFTTSEAYLKVNGAPNAPIVPLTVHWEPQPVDVSITGNVSPTGLVHKGDVLTYTLVAQNSPDAGGSASRTKLTYEIPRDVTYLASSGATCAPPGASSAQPALGSIGMPMPASVVGPATVTCDLGTLDPNQGKLVTIAVRVTKWALQVSGTFNVQAREPDNHTGNNTVTLKSRVIGLSFFSLATSTQSVNMQDGGNGNMTISVDNSGPNAGTDVVVAMDVPGFVSVKSAKASQGTCKVQGQLICQLGNVDANGSAQIRLSFHAAQVGSGQLGVKLKTTSENKNKDHNSAAVDIAVHAVQGSTGSQGSEGGGGLAFGGLALLALMALSAGMIETRRRKRRRD